MDPPVRGLMGACGKLGDWWVFLLMDWWLFHPPFPVLGPWIRMRSASQPQAALAEQFGEAGGGSAATMDSSCDGCKPKGESCGLF